MFTPEGSGGEQLCGGALMVLEWYVSSAVVSTWLVLEVAGDESVVAGAKGHSNQRLPIFLRLYDL